MTCWPRRRRGPVRQTKRLQIALLISTQNVPISKSNCFLALARRLALGPAPEFPQAGLEFWAALARQCFINEYVFFREADENRAAEKPAR